MATLELEDIQGIVIRGYANLTAACFVLLQIEDAGRARQWLAEFAQRVTPGSERPERRAAHIAFTFAGLEALGLGEETLRGFSEDFQAGMTTDHKQRILGDTEESAPGNWLWGGTAEQSAPVHALLLLYAVDDDELAALRSEVSEGFEAGGVRQVHETLETRFLREPREHFGFRDGISQPLIEGLSKAAGAGRALAAGEFILGYRNAYGLYTERPLVESRVPHASRLPEVPGDDREEHAGKRDLGRNGSYLVFRQLAQDVKGFWEFFRQATGDGEDADSTACIHLAAKMVGRWPSGAPVTKAPERDDPALGNDNDFGYHERDAAGLKCPIGAHIRRTNPRDSLEPDPGSEKSVEFADRHRILRRGRAYGDPVVESMQPEEIMRGDAAGERGLHFICLNANISRQFEFVQQTWTNNPRFDGLYDDPDPIVGPGGKFTEQATPVRRRIHDVPRFVTVRGGAYFFLPGLRALRYLAALQGRGA